MRAERAFVVASVAAATLVGCGSNNTNIPPELLAAIEKPATAPDGSVPDAYPSGPYGTREGEVTKDYCFQGWMDPKASGYDVSRVGRVCLSDFHADPDARVLLVDSSAIWCVACRAEYEGAGPAQPSLAAELGPRRSGGFRILGTLFQNAVSTPATLSDAATWAKAFAVDFPFGDDPDDQLGLFTSSVVAPVNLLVDTRTMKIVLVTVGNDPSVLLGAVDRILAGP